MLPAILDVLSRENGLRELSSGGNEFGIALRTETWSNGVVDFGQLNRDDLEIKDAPPLGTYP